MKSRALQFLRQNGIAIGKDIELLYVTTDHNNEIVGVGWKKGKTISWIGKSIGKIITL